MTFNPDSTLMLQEPLLRVPYETMRRTFKTAQKHIERETQAVGAVVSELNSGHLDRESASRKLEDLTNRMRGLKRKLSEIREEQDRNVANTKSRVDYLRDLTSIQSIESPEFEEWSKKRLNVLLVDYFLRNGYVETAQLQTQTSDVGQLVDSNLLLQCINIERSLLNKDTSECLNWCQENKTYLRKVRNSLDFEIRLQHYIELVKAGRKTEAVQYNRKFLSKSADTHLSIIQRASALLAFSPDTDIHTYQALYSEARWTTLANMFVSTFFTLHGLPSEASLIESLAAGISALKTYSCLQDTAVLNPEAESNGLMASSFGSSMRPKLDLSRAHMCPICSIELNHIAKPLPFALHVRSHLDSDPVVLPNGRIYGKEKLLQYSLKAGVPRHQVADPTSKEIFPASDMKDVYPS